MSHKNAATPPYTSVTFSRRFAEACKVLEIEDLRCHHLPHEGASRLAETECMVPPLAAVTGHSSATGIPASA